MLLTAATKMHKTCNWKRNNQDVDFPHIFNNTIKNDNNFVVIHA